MPLVTEPFKKLSPPALLGICLVLVLVIGIADNLIGYETSIALFYLLPIVMGTLRLGRATGFTLAGLSAVTLILAELSTGHEFAHPMIPYWNMSIRLFFFLFTVHLLLRLQQTEARQKMLGKIFFHDILNLAGSIRGFAELLRDGDIPPSKEIFEQIYKATDQAIDEIEAQRVIASAENKELFIQPELLSAHNQITRVGSWFAHHRAAENRQISIEPSSENILVVTDQNLLCRILGNLVKNALEATPEGGTIHLGVKTYEKDVLFLVHNQGVIPRDIQKRLFHQTVSTKGETRGMGIFSVRLLTLELGGRVSFTSTPEAGTTFRVRLPLNPNKNP